MGHFNVKNIELFEQCRAEHPDYDSSQIARVTGIPETSVRRYLSHRGGQAGAKSALLPAGSETAPQPGARQTGPAEFELVTKSPATLDELLSACKVDLKAWRVSRWIANKWDVGAKQEDGSVLVTPLWQIKAFLERLPGAVPRDALLEAVEEIRARTPLRTGRHIISNTALDVQDPHLLELDLADLHFDRLNWEQESGENWDMKISSHVAVQAVQQLLALSAPFPVRRILYVCGNDFYTADTPADTTTAGTPQDVDGRWQKSFKLGVRLQVDLIDLMRRRAPVDVVIVPGNHDTTRMFYAGVVLEALYSKCSDVRVINNAAPRKYYRWGTTLIGFSHGHSEKHGALPLIMAGEAPDDWAKTTHREFHVGHFHHKKETQFHAGLEVGPVRVRILPSLTATDGWHASQGYVGARKACEAYLWSEARGYVGHFSWGPTARREISVTQGSDLTSAGAAGRG